MDIARHNVSQAPLLGEKRFAVYIRGLPMPDLREGWLCQYNGLWRKGVTLLDSPKVLYSDTEAIALRDAMLNQHVGIDALLCELVPVAGESWVVS